MAFKKSNTGLTEPQFEKLFKEFFIPLSNFAKQYVQDLDTAKDITQKVFLTLWEKRSQMNPEQSIKSYLFTSVKNRSLNYIRDHKKYRSEVLDLDCGDINMMEEERPLEMADVQARVEQALNELPEKCRKVFELSRFRGMKYKEIAEELQIAQKTVEAHMSKAMKSLRENLKDLGTWLLVVLEIF